MTHLQACARQFALFLYENNHLCENFTIAKAEAQKLFKTFKKDHNLHVTFFQVLTSSHALLHRFKKNAILMYQEEALLALESGNPAAIDSRSNKGSIDSSQCSHQNHKKEKMPECVMCGVKFESQKAFQRHMEEQEHIFFRDVLSAQKISQSKLVITADDSPNLSNIVLRKNTPKSLVLKVRTTSNVPVTILSVQTNPKISEVKLNSVCPCKFSSSGSVAWDLVAHFKEEKVLVFPILIKTEDEGRVQNHVVELVFHTHDEFFDELHPLEPYRAPPKGVRNTLIENINVNDPPMSKASKGELRMKPYSLPAEVILFLNNNLKPFVGITKQQMSQLNYINNLIDPDNKHKSLSVKKNYAKLLEILLYAEEHQMLRNMKGYDQSEKTLERVGNLLELQVPDLSEGRPSILVTDVIRLKDTDGAFHNGVVRQVKESSVLLKFPKRFMDAAFFNNRKFHVSFTFNRYCLRAQHQAVDFSRYDNIEHFFFERTIPHEPLNLELHWFNEDIANNPEQQQAVRAILTKSAMPAPYIIFGPPGTGKTMTVAEAVKQIYSRTNDKVLICAPSNNAANELMKRLVDIVHQRDLFRLVATSFSDHMPKELIKFSNYKNGVCYQPPMSELVKYRVLITTLISAARLVNKRCPPAHFSYVFVDEAGQANESETLVALARILSDSRRPGKLFGQVVLAGDPRQLGPVIHSNFAKECGFDVSMLERLIDTCKQYQKDKLGKSNPSALTKLLKNYRSHPVLLYQPNILFYEQELQAAGDDLINTAVNWPHLPNKQFPLIFHGVMGVDQREKGSPSFFNIQEIQVVMDYLDKLIGCRMNGIAINESHIAVISPYKKQVEKFKQAFNKKGYNALTVCSVEQIQGQERLIVIISTVRSKPTLVNYDIKFNLGFLTNPKRFNVAITRAKALLIVVGNPRVLRFDQHWKSFIGYCKDNGALIGDNCNLPEGDNDDTDSGRGTSLSGIESQAFV